MTRYIIDVDHTPAHFEIGEHEELYGLVVGEYVERTCTIDYVDSGNGQCSACKEFVSIYDGWAPFGDDVYTNSYCPFCGAKVTNNEQLYY